MLLPSLLKEAQKVIQHSSYDQLLMFLLGGGGGCVSEHCIEVSSVRIHDECLLSSR